MILPFDGLSHPFIGIRRTKIRNYFHFHGKTNNREKRKDVHKYKKNKENPSSINTFSANFKIIPYSQQPSPARPPNNVLSIPRVSHTHHTPYTPHTPCICTLLKNRNKPTENSPVSSIRPSSSQI